MGIGIDQLPAHIRNSDLLTGNNLGRLGNIEATALPTTEEIEAFRHDPLVAYTFSKHEKAPQEQQRQLELLGKKLLEEGRLVEAWKTLLLAQPESGM